MPATDLTLSRLRGLKTLLEPSKIRRWPFPSAKALYIMSQTAEPYDLIGAASRGNKN
jgi:hypothetical protein